MIMLYTSICVGSALGRRNERAGDREEDASRCWFETLNDESCVSDEVSTGSSQRFSVHLQSGPEHAF